MPEREAVALYELGETTLHSVQPPFDEDLQTSDRNSRDGPNLIPRRTLHPFSWARPSRNYRYGVSLSKLQVFDLIGTGFAMNYGIFQEYYSGNWTLKGNRATTGVIGTTSNGVMYLSMPLLFALFTRRWARKRQTAAVCGALLTCVSFLLSSFSTDVWHLVVTQGILSAPGCTLVYSPTTLSLGEWFNTHDRALAYGVSLSCKNIVGSACPFLLRGLLDRYGFRNTLRIWTAIVGGSSLLAIFLIPTHPSSIALYGQ